MSSLRGRLVAAIGSIALLSVAVAFVFGAVLTRRAVERNTLRDVNAQADLLVERENAEILPCARPTDLRPFLRRQGQRAACARLGSSFPFLDVEEIAELRRNSAADGKVEVGEREYFFAARLVEKRRGFAFVLLRPTDNITSSWRPHVRGLLIGVAAAALLAAAAALLLARAIARPVRHVAEASRLLALAGSAPRVPEKGARELRMLAQSFNEMSTQLAKARAAERSFLLSVSHELKTPLTAIRGYAEGLADGAFAPEEAAETIAREATRLERLVRDLLDLARMNKSEFSIRSEPLDLGVATRETAARYEAAAASFGVALEVAVDGDAPALGDGDRVVQVVSNLVENALRVTPAGGTVRVVASAGTVVVEDDGPGLKPEELPRAFERFYLYSRYGRERPVGTGLGLAIVKELTEGMGGTVAVETNGDGTRFTVRLPLPRDVRAPAAQHELTSV